MNCPSTGFLHLEKNAVSTGPEPRFDHKLLVSITIVTKRLGSKRAYPPMAKPALFNFFLKLSYIFAVSYDI